MRILQIVHGLPPFGTGGTELYVDDLSQRLAGPGCAVLILAREADPARREYAVRRERRGGVEVAWINNTFSAVRSFEDSYRHPRIAAAAAALAEEFRPDVAHVHHLTCLSTEIPAALRARGIPIVCTLHDYWFICHRGQLLDLSYRLCAGPGEDGCGSCVGHVGNAGRAAHAAAGIVRRLHRAAPGLAAPATAFGARLIRLAAGGADRGREETRKRAAHMRSVCELVDGFLAPSEDARRRYIAFGIDAERILRHEQGILAPAPVTRRDREGPLHVGFFGSLIPAKGIEVLLDAFSRLPRGRAVLRVYGRPAPYHQDTAPMHRIARALGLPGVELIGPVPRGDVSQAMRDLDLVAVPSIWPENAPFVVREALAAGVPVLASRIGGLPEVVRDGVNGWLVAPGDAAAWAEKLRDLSASAAWRARVVARGAIKTIEQDALETRGIYERFLSRRRVPTCGTRGRVAAVVLNYQTPGETALCVGAARASRRALDAIIVVDNGSTDDGAALRRASPDATILSSAANLGFAGGVNIGIRRALCDGADFVLLLNSDVILPPDALGILLDALERDPSAGIAGPAILSRSEPDVVASLGMMFSPRSGRMVHRAAGRRFDQISSRGTDVVHGVSGCAMLIRKCVFEAAGLFDERYFFGYEDLDLCLRAGDAGFATICCAQAAAYHEGGATLDRRSPRRVYYGVRNHLNLVSDRAGSRTARVLQRASVLLLTGAYVLRSADVPLWSGVAALGRGVRDHFAGRYGKG